MHFESGKIVNKRIIWVDSLRALLIFLVVIGHCIQYSCSNYNHNALFRVIYSFHMPLFMLISGFVSYKTLVNWNVIRRRAVQLLIPFFFYTIVAAFVRWDTNILFETVTYPEKGLWFLWTLFFIVCVNTCAVKIANSLKVHSAIIDLVFLVILFVSGHFIGLFCLATIAKFYLYYSVGLYIRRYESVFLNEKRNAILSFATLLTWGGMVFAGFINTEIGTNTLFKIVMAIMGSIAFVSLFKGKVHYGCSLMQKVGGGVL